ncbi:hypothetical protein SAMN05661093_10956 [Kibdelosporangium aridum]|uniref:Uncharacterized protein n=1 Tax=Kibdelosporangium aridum TaxID=2030 RepID=A0A1W2FZS0_KIBAR|nr:hypothetical protein SAMN05661093_10956 [Kibdelosporangium aridum]
MYEHYIRTPDKLVDRSLKRFTQPLRPKRMHCPSARAIGGEAADLRRHGELS